MRNELADRPDSATEEQRALSGGTPRERLPNPDQMRQAVADYVRNVHEAYVRQASMLPPATQGRLPLFSLGPFSVAAVGTRFLHLVATREALGAVVAGSRGDAAQMEQAAPPLRWTLTFFDPVILPGLGLLDERTGPAFDEVRRLLGLRTHVYHLTLSPPADLAPHHAGHTGAGLAGAHAAAAREFEAIRSAVPASLTTAAEEFEGAVVAGLPHAAALLARELAPSSPEVALAADHAVGRAADPAALRRAVLQAVRGQVTGSGREA